MLFFYLVGFVILISGGILFIAFPGFRSSATNEANGQSFEECVPLTLRKNSNRTSFPLPKPPPLSLNDQRSLNS